MPYLARGCATARHAGQRLSVVAHGEVSRSFGDFLQTHLVNNVESIRVDLDIAALGIIPKHFESPSSREAGLAQTLAVLGVTVLDPNMNGYYRNTPRNRKKVGSRDRG